MQYSNPSVYVIIPNKNGKIHLEYSLASLFRSTYSNFKVILVDSNSTDDSIEFVKKNYKEVLILSNSGKKGFAGGVNTGLKFAIQNKANYVAIFNSDIKVLNNWIELGLYTFKSQPMIGVVGYFEILRNNENLFNDARISYEHVKMHEVNAVAGCLFMMDTNLLLSIGLLDEDYYMYGEDNDWFYRICRSSFSIIETNIPVWHYGEGSANNNKFMPTWYSYRNALRFSIKNEPFLMNLKMVLSLINQGCNILLKKNHPSVIRLQRYNPLINLFFIGASIIWNLVHLIPTLKARNEKINL